MLLPLDYCPDPHSLAHVSEGLAEYDQISALRTLALERGYTDFLIQQRESQRWELELLAARGNLMAKLTLAFFYLDYAYEGSLFRTSRRVHGVPFREDEETGELYISCAKRYITQLLTEADGESLFALSRELRNLCWQDSFSTLHLQCLEAAARRGHTEAQRVLAGIYLHGDIGLKPNRSRGLYWLRKAAAADTVAAEWLHELENPPAFS